MLATEPDLANACYMLGVMLEERRRIQEAIACYRKAIALAPDLSEAHVALGPATIHLIKAFTLEAA